MTISLYDHFFTSFALATRINILFKSLFAIQKRVRFFFRFNPLFIICKNIILRVKSAGPIKFDDVKIDL